MITRRTVLILGAGASVPYGYPTGQQLRQRVIEDLKGQGSTDSIQTLAYGEFDGQLITRFKDALLFSAVNSIDELLESRSDLVEIGKAAIAWKLVQSESLRALFDSEQNWYQHIWSHMNDCPPERFPENKLSVVTFNYDRSFEVFLFHALSNKYEITESQASDILKSLPSIHLHGILGSLPWQGGRPYRAIEGPKDIRSVSRSIKVIHESARHDADFQVARQLISDAQQVIFIGFGYHETNLRRLLEGIRSDAEFCGSCTFLAEREIRRVAGRFSDWFKLQFAVGSSDHKALEFLRENVDLI